MKFNSVAHASPPLPSYLPEGKLGSSEILAKYISPQW